jgi:hypothetical protein
VADCAVAFVVLGGKLRETWVIVAWYVCVNVSDFVKPRVSEKSNKIYMRLKASNDPCEDACNLKSCSLEVY